GRGGRARDLHPACPRLALAFPRVDRALAARGTAEGSHHRRIDLFPRRPRLPLMEVRDERKNLLGRSVDGRRALDAERVRFGRGEGEKCRDQDDENDDDDLEDLEHGARLRQGWAKFPGNLDPGPIPWQARWNLHAAALLTPFRFGAGFDPGNGK